MAHLLKAHYAAGGSSSGAPRGFWPVDLVVLPYYGAATIAILIFWRRLPEPAWLLVWHMAAIALAIWAIRATGRASWIFRHWYPLPYVAWCYREMAVLMPSLRRWDADAELAHLDRRVWGVNPTVWLERIANPVLTEYLQIVYALFVPVVVQGKGSDMTLPVTFCGDAGEA